VTAQRAINRLRAEGWIEKTIEGYRALDPPLYPFYALRAHMEELLNRGIRLLDIPPDGSPSSDREWLVQADWLSLDLAETLGLWARAIDRRLLDRGRALRYFFGRYNNATVDSMLNAIGAAPNVTSVLHDYYRIEQIFKNSLPLIPLFDQQDEQEFNGNVVTGEPTLSNPYAASAVYIAPDLGWVAMHIAPAH
jgi:hypothetical protein